MSTLNLANESTFWRICDDFGKCHCDFRYTIYDCEETEIAKILYTITAATSGVLALVAFAVLYFRLNYRNQKIFEIRNGFPRPKPIEAMCMFGIVFNILQTIHAIFMLTNSIPNPVFRSFMFEVGFDFGYCCFACYLFGVAYTLSESNCVMYNTWVKSHTMVNILCLATITLPFLTNTACAVAAAAHAVNGNIELASKLTMAQYYFWTFYCGYLGTLLLVAGIRLIRLLDKHMFMKLDLRINVNKIKTGALKVKLIVIVGTSCLWIFSFLVTLYSACRYEIMTHQSSNMVVAAVWLFAGPVATFFVEIAVLFNPEIAAQLSSLSFGSTSSDLRMNNDPFRNEYNCKKLTFKQLGFSSKSESMQGSNFIISSSQLDDDIRFSLNEIKAPQKSIDTSILQEKTNNKVSSDENLTQVEEEQAKYNATIGRVRTPSPSHNYSHINSA